MNVSCQCGKIAFTTLRAKPLALYICHCKECRKQSGSLFSASAEFPGFPLPPSLESDGFIKRHTRVGSSGQMHHDFFCTTCGGHILGMADGDNSVSVAAGCIEGTERLPWREADNLWCGRAVLDIPKEATKWEKDVGMYEGWKTEMRSNA